MARVPRTYELNEREAELAHAQVDSHCKALLNWTASKVETGDLDGARALVAELREHQALYAKLNVRVHRDLDGAGKP